MNLMQDIKELLFKHECVLIPKFGAFLVQSIPISIDREQGVFHPPSKKVSFNSLITQNDGILAKHLERKEGISYEKAINKINYQVLIWKKQIENQTIAFDRIGKLKLNSEKKIIFTPFNEINFDLNSVGLSSFSLKATKSIKKETVKSVLPLTSIEKPIMLSKKTQPVEIEGETIINKSTFYATKKQFKTMDNSNNREDYSQIDYGSSFPLKKYAAILLIILSISGGGYYFGNDYIMNKKIEAIEIAQQQVKSDVQKATFDLGKLSTVNLSVPTTAKKDEATTNNNRINRSSKKYIGYYSVIAGSFRNVKNAERKINQLKKVGFDAAYSEKNREGLTRVIFGRFKSKSKAYEFYDFIKYSLEEEAWILRE